MAVELVWREEGKKFLWDGCAYPSRAEAEEKRDAYQAQGFEVRLLERDGQPLLYTRRVVRQTSP